MSRKEIILLSFNNFKAVKDNIVNFFIFQKQTKRSEHNIIIRNENNISIIFGFLHVEEIIRMNVIDLISMQIKQRTIISYNHFLLFTGVFEVIESKGKNLV